MRNKTALGIMMGSLLLGHSSVYAETGVNVSLGFVQTDITLDLEGPGGSEEASDDYLSTELKGTLSFDEVFVSGAFTTSRLDEDGLDSFSLLGGYRLNEQASVFVGFSTRDYEDVMDANGFFAGYSYLIPFESSALVISGALGILSGDLDDAITGGADFDSDPSIGYNLTARYLYPINDQVTISGDITTYQYSYDFESDGGDVDFDESNFGIGVTASYNLK